MIRPCGVDGEHGDGQAGEEECSGDKECGGVAVCQRATRGLDDIGVVGGESAVERTAVTDEIDELTAEITIRVTTIAPSLLAIVGCGAWIGQDTRVVDAVIGDRARIGARIELAAGARSWPDVTLADGCIRFSSDA